MSKIVKSNRFIDIKNHKFGGLTAVKYLGIIKNKSYWKCKCVCGKYINVEKGKLTVASFGTKSCGCLTNRTSTRINIKQRLGTNLKTIGGFSYLP